LCEIMTRCLIAAIVLFGYGGGTAWAGAGAERGEAVRTMASAPVSLGDYDINLVVDAVVKAMGDAARDYYLPDKPENSKAIKRYTKDARAIIMMDTSFKREFGQVCVDVANAAANAGRDTEMLPGRPLVLPLGLAPVEIGVSSITASMDGDMKMIYTNTMPCIQASATTLHRATLRQFPDTASNPDAKEAYGRKFGSILTANRLYNHVLSEVCAKLVGYAEKVSAQNRKK